MFGAWPLRGHCVQLIALAEELKSRGYEVVFAIPSPAESWLEGRDVPVLRWEPQTSTWPGQFAAELDGLFAWASGEVSIWKSEWVFFRYILDRYMDVYYGIRPTIERYAPHLIIAEHASLPVIEIGHELGIPCLRVAQFLGGLAGNQAGIPHWATALPRHMSATERLRNRLVRAMDVFFGIMVRRLDKERRRRLHASRGLDDLLATTPLLVGSAFGIEIARPLPPRVHVVGPIQARDQARLDQELAAWLDRRRTTGVLYVSLGTLAVPSERQIAALLRGLSASGLGVLWSLPREQQRGLPAILPDHVRIEPFVAQAAVLAHPAVRGFVTHCGRNGLHEALWHGRPLLCLPFFGDQHYNAARMVDAGAGIRLGKDALRWRDVRRAALRLVQEPSFADSAARLGVILRTSDGLNRAIGIIECMLEAGADHWL